MPSSSLIQGVCRPARCKRHCGVTHRLVAWATNARAHRVVCLVAGLWIVNAFDLVLTITASRQQLLYELNPVAERMLSHGEGFLVLYKFGLLAVASYLLLRFRRERIAEMGSTLALAVYVMVAVHWRDCYDVYAQTDVTVHQEAWLDPISTLEP